MMVAISAAPVQAMPLGTVVPIRRMPLPAWTYIPAADRPVGLPASAQDAALSLAHALGEIAGTIRSAPGAQEFRPRLEAWAVARCAAAEGLPLQDSSGTGRTHDARDAGHVEGAGNAEGAGHAGGAGHTHGTAAQRCWSVSLEVWSQATGLRAGLRRAPAWIGPSVRLAAGGSTVPPPPHMLADAIACWQRSIEGSAGHGESPLVRAALDAAWSLWCIHFLQPVDQASGFLGRIVAGRVLATRAGLPAAVVPAASAGPLRAEDNVDLGAAYESWVRMCLESLARDAVRTSGALRDALSARARIIDAAARMRAPRHPTMLAHAFVRQPRMSMQEAARAMGISFRAAQAVMGKFLDDGIVREDTGRRRDRLYVCDGMLFPTDGQGERLPEPASR
jgi:hypothetical protein